MITSFTRISSNTKTGPIPVSLTEQSSCPDTCPFKSNKSCYPFFSPLGFMWEALDHDGFHPSIKDKTRRRVIPLTWDELCDNVSSLPKRKKQLWRHNAAGDLPGIGNEIDTQKLEQLVLANKKAQARGFSFTHKPVGLYGLGLRNACAIRAANIQGFIINLSANGLTDADWLADLNIGPVVTIVPSSSPTKMKTPKGRKVVVCPAQQDLKVKITCDSCELCAKGNRKSIIAFRAHGRKKKLVDKYLLNVIQ